MDGWFEVMKPRDIVEVNLTESAFYHSWQLERLTVREAARLCAKAHTQAEDERNRVWVEVLELVRRLLKPPFGRPTALPCDPRRVDDQACVSAAAGAFEPADHPSLINQRLGTTEYGCQWLLDLWVELRTSLEKEQGRWLAPNDSEPSGS